MAICSGHPINLSFTGDLAPNFVDERASLTLDANCLKDRVFPTMRAIAKSTYRDFLENAVNGAARWLQSNNVGPRLVLWDFGIDGI